MSRVSLGKSLTSVSAFTYKHANFECLQSLMKISTFCLRFTSSYPRSCIKALVSMFLFTESARSFNQGADGVAF